MAHSPSAKSAINNLWHSRRTRFGMTAAIVKHLCYSVLYQDIEQVNANSGNISKITLPLRLNVY